MDDPLLLGIRRSTIALPRWIWQRQVHGGKMLGFMTEDHRRIRNWVVTELPRAGEPLAPERIAQQLNLPLDRVVSIVDDLEKRMTFVFRNAEGAVEWAYPVTAAQTPHRMTCSSGERFHAA